MNRLPVELIILIAQYLNKTSLTALARSSRHYCDIALPYVYTNVLLANYLGYSPKSAH
ncbi:F-box protein [Aspergillus undulatus]|uniref:F-box protein n=1 Tax=Aspergillus undulatus TaxID=1810928 RepID=UPI003CCD86AE